MAKSKTTTRQMNIGGLIGRQLFVPAKKGSKNKQILLIYGLHSSIERMRSSAEFLSRYGNVILPDLPGIGGMDSFYVIKRNPTLDNYADYLYTFLISSKMNKRLTVVAMSFGFLVVTRMLQMHPQSQKWIDELVSFVGFGQSSDFINLSKMRRWQLPLCRTLSTPAGSTFVKYVVFNPLSLRVMFSIFKLFNPKYKHGMATNKDKSESMELMLWQQNDARTRFALYELLMNFNLTRRQKVPIKLHLHNMTTPTDQYFDHDHVEKSLSKLYKKVSTSTANMKLHAPSIIGTEAEVDNIFSDEVKQVLAS